MSGSPNPQCSHLIDLFSDDSEKAELVTKYKKASIWANFRLYERAAKRRRIDLPSCGTCHYQLHRPFLCLHCSYAGCWKEGHVAQHLSESGHTFCVDASSGSLFCCLCNDVVYADELEEIHEGFSIAAEERRTKFQFAKKGREPYASWKPDDKDTSGTTLISCQRRRGLLNLGQTCFLNSTLQTLLHNPLLKSYFLSDRHNSKLCTKRDAAEAEGGGCMACEMDRLFSRVFTGDDGRPIGPTSTLAAVWKSSPTLSGYAQHDAHECLMALLTQIHAGLPASTHASCICAVHAVFAGVLQSDVKCTSCGQLKVNQDPLMDISLALRGERTLEGCLRRYTAVEKLPAGEYTCSKCKSSTDATKRLSIHKLPPVLSFQFKRFEHRAKSATKIESPVRFPSTLNMRPFTTLSISNEHAKTAAVVDTGSEVMYMYDLFAVVNHTGQMHTGHYTSYCRSEDEWYHFDDDKVTHASLGNVLSSTTTAYMVFYVKQQLEYRPVQKPTYVVNREVEIAKEKERERLKEKMQQKEVEDFLLAAV